MQIAPRYGPTPIIAVEGSAAESGAALVRQRRRLQATLAGLADDEWATPSRCEGWSVQDVIAHLVGTNTFWAASASAGLQGSPTRILAQFDPAATPALMVDGMRTLSPGQVMEQFADSNDAFLAVMEGLDDRGWDTLVESPAGHVPIRLLSDHALWDSWVHERDVALPLGLDQAVEADEVGACLRYAAAISPALALTMSDAVTGSFAVEATDPDLAFVVDVGDAVAVRARAGTDGTDGAPCLQGPAVELLEALSVRGPLPASAPPEWRSLLGGLMTAFDQGEA